jgi:DNA polymerase-3 subunit delta
MNKLIITLPEGKPVITTNLIEKNIGISKDYNNFNYRKRLAKEITEANMIVHHFASNPKDNPITLTIASLFTTSANCLLTIILRQIQKQRCCGAENQSLLCKGL